MEWFDFFIPRTLLNRGYNNYRAHIFNMPEESVYTGYTFAHPRKLARYERGGYMIRLNDDWTFHLRKEKEPGTIDEEAPEVALPFAEWFFEMTGMTEQEYQDGVRAGRARAEALLEEAKSLAAVGKLDVGRIGMSSEESERYLKNFDDLVAEAQEVLNEYIYLEARLRDLQR